MSHEKYIRQIALPQVGHSGQHKLGHSRVLVVGAGGLGNAVLPYLASWEPSNGKAVEKFSSTKFQRVGTFR